MKDVKRERALLVGSLIVLFSSVISLTFAEYTAQKCVTDTIMAQIGFVDDPDVNAAVPHIMKEIVDNCAYTFSMLAALFLGFSSVAAAILGAILSNRLRARQSAKVYAHYDPGTHKLTLRFDKPVAAQNPQRMALLYHHAGGMAAAVPGRQCKNSGLMLVFTTDVKETPTSMELVICSGAICLDTFPKPDVCASGRPIHVEVNILMCDT